MLLRTLATPMLSATYPDQLGRGSGWVRQVPIARGGPMGSAGGLLSPPLRVQRVLVRQIRSGNGSLIAG